MFWRETGGDEAALCSDRQYSECVLNEGGERSCEVRNLGRSGRQIEILGEDTSRSPMPGGISDHNRVGAITTHFDPLQNRGMLSRSYGRADCKGVLRRIPDGGIVRALPELSKVRQGEAKQRRAPTR